MATTGDGKKLCKRPFQPEIDEKPQNVSREAVRNNSSGVSELNTHQAGNSAAIGKLKLEQMLKQMTFTRSETQHFIALLHSRTIEESLSDNFLAPILSSSVVEEQIASPIQLANAYKGNTCGSGQALRQDSKTSMASPQHPVTMENLPEELLLNIFIRLLSKQLAQMRSVSKSWNALLSQSSFVKSHLHRSIHNNDQFLLIFHDDVESSSDFKPVTAIPCRPPHLELTNLIKPPANPQSRYKSITVIGAVNGLICSFYSGAAIHIWNPSLSAVLTLPSYSTPTCDNDTIRIYFRFGFDPKTDDYKVIKLTGLEGPHIDVIRWWLQVEVYSMRRGSWELITGRFPSHVIKIVGHDVACADGHDGHLHWLGYTDEKSDSERIVAFDLGSETFHEMPVPESTLDHVRQNVLSVLGGKLCVMSWDCDGACEVWVMEEYGVTGSWVKHHVFSQFTDDTWPFGFTSHNELLLENNGYLVLYDPFANEQKIMEDHCSEEYSLDRLVEYVDSLVWVAPAKCQMVDAA